MSWRLITAIFALALAPVRVAGAESVDVYLTLEEAPKAVLPEADSFERRDIPVDDAFREKMKELIGRARPTIWEPFYISFIAKKNDQVIGYAVVCEEIGKHRPITFIVAADPRGQVKDVALMMYREPIGAEVRYGSFLRQFEGKKLEDPIMLHRDIRNISGATLSVRAMSRGVRKALAVIQLAYVEKKEQAGPAISNRSVTVVARHAPPVRASGGVVRRAHYVMGTIFEITARGPRFERTAEAVQEAFSAIRRADAVLSHYREDSDLTRLNRLGAEQDVAAPEELYRLLEHAARLSGLSGGAFDVTAGPLVELWQGAGESRTLPSKTELARARTRVGWQKVRLLPGQRVRFTHPGPQIDLGAIGKGWALDQALAVLRDHGIEHAFLSAGTSTVYALGDDGDGDGWLVGIRDPRGREDHLLAALRLRNAALSTSASYERFWEIAGRRYSHIVDPRSGRPVEGMLGSTVIAPAATEADALSTAAFVLGLDEGSSLLERLRLGGLLIGRGPSGVIAMRRVGTWDGAAGVMAHARQR